jgi:crotonobetainyl-CoA:carnitine CoA-transferase CaiB-like acyl-CoA transferase
LWLDLARGKRSAHLDLKTDAGVRAMTALVRDADIFMQAYRPHALAQLGFDVADVQRIRPGAIYISLSAFGHTGPWADRRGFDSLVQTVSGIGQAGAAAADREGTRPLPCQALDHATGYLAALGATCALKRRAIEGGSYAVRISLAQTSNWLWSLGTVNGIDTPDLKLADIEHRLEVRTTSHGEIKAIAPAERLSATPAHYVRDASLLGADAASF